MSDANDNDNDPAVKLTSVVVNTLSNNHGCYTSTCFTDEAMACQSSVLFATSLSPEVATGDLMQCCLE